VHQDGFVIVQTYDVGVIEFQVIFHVKFDKIQNVSFLRKLIYTAIYILSN
jgi:hypothetical protein